MRVWHFRDFRVRAYRASGFLGLRLQVPHGLKYPEGWTWDDEKDVLLYGCSSILLVSRWGLVLRVSVSGFVRGFLELSGLGPKAEGLTKVVVARCQRIQGS